MKAISIGRDNGCDIVLNDNTDIISRRHAVLNIYSTGKMTIVDQGRNGTYVNGIRITPNVPFPVSRKDVVSFAHIIQLDWALVPNSASRMRNIVVGIVLFIVVSCGVSAYFINHHNTDKTIIPNNKNATKKDSIKRDSVNKDTAKYENKDTKKKIKKVDKKEKPKATEDKNKDTKKEKSVSNRNIG